MGLEGATYQFFRTFLGRAGCAEGFDRAFCHYNHATQFDAAHWEASEAEYIFAHAFDWSATPEGRDFWREIDQRWCKEIVGHQRTKKSKK